MFRKQTRVAALLAAAVLICGGADAAWAQGTHTPIPNMNNKRALHTATRLADGRVLVVGGEDPFLDFEPLATAEIYDPTLNTWTYTDSLSKGRDQHTATLLQDGRVLVTGGEDPDLVWRPRFRILRSAEIYDPATGTFTSAGDMNEHRMNHTATRLADGRVLIAGGLVNSDLVFPIDVTRGAAAEIYDPASGTFTALPAMHNARSSHTATLLNDGRVLIVGGDGLSQASAEIFDPVTNTFTLLANTATTRRQSHGAVRLLDGRVFIAGGSSSAMTAEIFDPSVGSFQSAGTMPSEYDFWGVIELLDDGRVYMASATQAWLFNPSSGTFSARMTSGVGDLFIAGARLSGNRVLVTGGQNFVPYTFVSVNAARIFEPNEAPLADAGEHQTISPGANCIAAVTLDGSGSSDADGDTLTYEWKQGTTVIGTSATAPVSLGVGVHEFTLTVTDSKGATDTATVTITVADSTPPSLSLPTPITLEQASAAGSYFEFPIPIATDNCDPNPTVSITGVPSGSIFPAGVTNVEISVTDAAGNTASGVTTVTVVDTTAPALSLPTNIIATAANAAGAAVTFTVTAIDLVTTDPLIACIPASGSVFAIGVTTVACSATDAAGNTANGSFTVTVLTQNPAAVNDTAETVADTPVTIPVLANDADADGGTLSVVIGTPPAHGALLVNADQTITYMPTSGFIGVDTFTYVAHDNQGGASTAATVTVTVNEPSTLPQFVVLGVNRVWLKANVVVKSGDVGAITAYAGAVSDDLTDVNDESDDIGQQIGASTAEVMIGTRVKLLDESSRVVGDTVRMQPHASIYNLETNELVNLNGTVLGTTTALELPHVDLPAMPSITAGAGAQTIRRNVTATLAPGVYGRIKVERNATLVLTGGVYEFAALELDPEATLLYQAATELRIAGTMRSAQRARVVAGNGLSGSDLVIYVAGTGTAVELGQHSVTHANIVAPNGTLWIRTRAQATGAFVGSTVVVSPHVTLTRDSAFD
jgi:hypothetical protein